MKRAFASFAIAAVLLALRGSAVHADELDPGADGAAPTPFGVPPGLYVVTDVYAGDVVTASDGATTYSTATIRANPGTWARVLDTVGTGETSGYDGRSFNGRARLADGRPVAGTYYETFVLTSYGFVPVSIVFFQDDRESRETSVPSPAPTSAPTLAPTLAPTPAPTIAPVTPSATAAGTPRAVATPPPAPAPSARPAPTMPPPPVFASAAVALSSSGPTLASIELLRGRTVQLWPRAFADGVAVSVRSWRLVASSGGIAQSITGLGSQPCAMSWLLPSSDAPQLVRFEVTSDSFPGSLILATIAVTIRSPALLQ